MNIIVNLHGNADTVTLADAKATGKCDLIFDMMFFDSLLQKLNDLGRTLEVAGASYANLYDHCIKPRP